MSLVARGLGVGSHPVVVAAGMGRDGATVPPIVTPGPPPWSSGSDTVGPMYRRPNDDDDVLVLFML